MSRAPPGDLVDAVVHQGVPGDVHAQQPLAGPAEVQQAPHYGGNQVTEGPGRVWPGKEVTPTAASPRVMVLRLPVRQRQGRAESLRAQLPGGVRLGDHGQIVIQVARRDPVEVISVVMGEHDEIQLRQLLDGEGWFGQPPGSDAQAHVGPVAAVQKIRVREDGKPCDLDKGGGGSDERDLIGIRWCLGWEIHEVRLRGELVGRMIGQPFQQHDGGVVAQPAVLVFDDRPVRAGGASPARACPRCCAG